MATKTVSKKVQKKAGGVPAVRGPGNVPSWIAKDKTKWGLEAIDQQDVIVPRLAICQAMSDQRKRGSALYIEGLEEGMCFNTVTREVYGEGPFTVCPLMMYKTRIMFVPRDEGGGILCQSQNGVDGCQLNKGGPCLNQAWKDGEPPGCTLFFNYPVLLQGRTPELIAVSMKGAGIKHARNWNTMLRLANRSAFTGLYELSVVSERNPKGEYFVFDVRPLGLVKDEALYNQARDLYVSLKGKNLVTDLTGDDDPEEVNEELG